MQAAGYQPIPGIICNVDCDGKLSSLTSNVCDLNSEAAKAAAPTPTATAVSADNGALTTAESFDEPWLTVPLLLSKVFVAIAPDFKNNRGRIVQHRISEGSSASGLEMCCVVTAQTREAAGQMIETGPMSGESGVYMMRSR